MSRINCIREEDAWIGGKNQAVNVSRQRLECGALRRFSHRLVQQKVFITGIVARLGYSLHAILCRGDIQIGRAE
jgi:hypothetical protein